MRWPIPTLSALLLALPLSGPAQAASVSGSFTVQITIQAKCKIQSTTSMNFGTRGVLDAAFDATATITVICTNATPYNVLLDGGGGGSVAARVMTGGGGATVGYQLYRDAGRTLVWGQTIGTDTVAANGTGSAQAHTVYGRVPAQATPAVGVYNDTITVTVEY